MAKKKSLYKLIFNPKAGKKRNILKPNGGVSLQEIKALLSKYQLPTDFYPSSSPAHFIQLAKTTQKEGYKYLLVAGGDGTVSASLGGIVGTDVTLGILPLGTFMNAARMLSIPNDVEKAIMLIKIGRTRKIDVGVVTKFDGEKLDEPFYFLETAGIGLDAEMQELFLKFEKGNLMVIFEMMKAFMDFYAMKTEIQIDGESIKTKSAIINVSNGPYTGAALKMAPKSKLNDHRLTVSLYEMPKKELFMYFYNLMIHKKTDLRKVKIYHGSKVRILSKKEIHIHVDARLFGTTPAEFKVLPGSINVFSGFPESKEESSLIARTYLDL